MLKKLIAAIASEIGRDELTLVGGLVLVGVGLWWVYPPAGLIAPGLVLIWIALPQRDAFLHRPVITDRKKAE